MENSQGDKKDTVLHPISAIKTKKEIKKIKKEIALAEEKSTNKKIIIGTVAILLALIVFIGIMTAIESNKDPDVRVQSESIQTTGDNDTAETTKQSNTEELTEASTTFAEDNNDYIIESQTLSGEQITKSLSISDFKVQTVTDFAHLDRETIKLGTNEGVTISVETKKEDVNWADLWVDFDDTVLDIKFEDPIQNDGTTILRLYAKGKSVGESEVKIFSAQDLKTEENIYCFNFIIDQLDSIDGRIVYYTPYGEKYHFRENCAGENASATTYYDAIASGYSPCAKCAG